MAYNNSERPASRRPARRRRKVCVFCGGEEISYKDAAKLKKYVSERGKILPRRVTGTCATCVKHCPNVHFESVNK